MWKTDLMDIDKRLNSGNEDVEKNIFSITKDGIITNANKSFSQTLMPQVKSVIGVSIYEFIHEEDRTLFNERVISSNGRTLIPFSFRFNQINGDDWHFYVKWCKWVSLNEVIVHAIPILETNDYTVVERSLIEKESTIFDITDRAAVIYDLNGRIFLANDSFVNLFGWSFEEVRGKRVPIIPDSLWQEFVEIQNRILRGEKVVRKKTIRKTRNGIMLPINLIMLPEYDRDGNIQGFIAISKELEETLELKTFVEKQMIEILKRETLLEDITSNLEIGVCQYDVEKGVFLYVSPAIERLLGIPMLELLKDPTLFVSTCHEEDRTELIQFYLGCFDVLKNFEYRVVNEFGEIVWIRTEITPVFDETGKIVRYVSITQDISKQKAQDELLRKWDKLSVVGSLAASVAHEIRNPLTSVKGFIQLIGEESSSDYAPIIMDELENIESIMDEFLLLAKPSGEMEFAPASLYFLINRAITLLGEEAKLNGISFLKELYVEDRLVICESKQIKRVLVNLMKNAIEAMPCGGKLKISMMYEDDKTVKISIEDNGIGISPERLNKLGEPFYSNSERGIGLGLMISYKIIEHHSGSIHFVSKEGFGTTVEIRLPFVFI